MRGGTSLEYAILLVLTGVIWTSATLTIQSRLYSPPRPTVEVRR